MANKIVLKKSSVSSKVPLATDLDYGELALNYTDEKLYFKNASNAIKSFNVTQSTLTIGTGLSGTSYNGTSAVTIAIDSTVATLTGTQTLTNKTIAAGSNTITGLTNANLSGTAGITNANLANSSVTINSTSVSLGGSATITAANPNALTIGTGLSGTSYNGASAVTIALASAYGDTLNPYASKTANNFLAAPNGTAGVPTFRAIVAADIPTLNQNTTGTASNVTGTVAIANGGTGATTRQEAIDALAGAVTAGLYLRGNGTDVVMSAIQAADVPTLNQNTTGTASNVTGTVAIANGGTGATTRQNAMDALAGSVTSGQYLRGNGTDVVMSAIQAADVPTLNQNTTGSAATLTTSRNINGTAFNGSADITVPLNTTNRTTNETGHMVFTGTTATGNVSAYTNTAVRVNPSQGRVEANGISAAAGLIEHANNITVTYTMKTGNNAISAGPVTIDTGGSITIPDGSTWIIVSPT
jgi:hypothetical protein